MTGRCGVLWHSVSTVQWASFRKFTAVVAVPDVAWRARVAVPCPVAVVCISFSVLSC